MSAPRPLTASVEGMRAISPVPITRLNAEISHRNPRPACLDRERAVHLLRTPLSVPVPVPPVQRNARAPLPIHQRVTSASTGGEAATKEVIIYCIALVVRTADGWLWSLPPALWRPLSTAPL